MSYANGSGEADAYVCTAFLACALAAALFGRTVAAIAVHATALFDLCLLGLVTVRNQFACVCLHTRADDAKTLCARRSVCGQCHAWQVYCKQIFCGDQMSAL